MQKIPFEDLPSTNTPINSTNLNLLQSNIETTLNNYSTTEQVIGTWLGQTLYRKVIDCGAMPNNTTKYVATGLTNVFITSIHGVMYNAGAFITLPDVNPSGVEYSIRLFYDRSNNSIALTTGADRSTYNGYVVLEYIKTSS